MQKHSTEFEALRRAGFEKYVQRLKDTAEERFWARVDKGLPDDCWPFTGCICHKYGWVNFEGKNRTAHSVAYRFTFGDYDHSLDVCHKCDNPPCCNPAHLFLGTRAENMQDMWRKNRHPRIGVRGERSNFCKLKEYQVFEIRQRHESGETQRSIAKFFGVNWRTVNLIVLRKNWKHI